MNRSSKKFSSSRLLSALSLVTAIVLSSACASTPVAPANALVEARDAISIAEQAGARQYAGAELDEAQHKLELAERSVSNEKMTDAEVFAKESLISAELASARTESAKAVEINEEMRRSADALDEEMQRAGDSQ